MDMVKLADEKIKSHSRSLKEKPFTAISLFTSPLFIDYRNPCHLHVSENNEAITQRNGFFF